jgi:hypothetical protein
MRLILHQNYFSPPPAAVGYVTSWKKNLLMRWRKKLRESCGPNMPDVTSPNGLGISQNIGRKKAFALLLKQFHIF